MVHSSVVEWHISVVRSRIPWWSRRLDGVSIVDLVSVSASLSEMKWVSFFVFQTKQRQRWKFVEVLSFWLKDTKPTEWACEMIHLGGVLSVWPNC